MFTRAGKPLLITAVLAVLMFGFYFGYRAWITGQTAKQLCQAIAISASLGDPANLRPGDYGYSYAQAHKDEWPSQADRDKALQSFDCSTIPPKKEGK